MDAGVSIPAVQWSGSAPIFLDRSQTIGRLRKSPNLQPCKKFRKVTAARFVEHLNEGKCEQCLAFFRMLDRAQQLMTFLRENRNGTERRRWLFVAAGFAALFLLSCLAATIGSHLPLGEQFRKV